MLRKAEFKKSDAFLQLPGLGRIETGTEMGLALVPGLMMAMVGREDEHKPENEPDGRIVMGMGARLPGKTGRGKFSCRFIFLANYFLFLLLYFCFYFENRDFYLFLCNFRVNKLLNHN